MTSLPHSSSVPHLAVRSTKLIVAMPWVRSPSRPRPTDPPPSYILARGRFRVGLVRSTDRRPRGARRRRNFGSEVAVRPTDRRAQRGEGNQCRNGPMRTAAPRGARRRKNRVGLDRPTDRRGGIFWGSEWSDRPTHFGRWSWTQNSQLNSYRLSAVACACACVAACLWCVEFGVPPPTMALFVCDPHWSTPIGQNR